MKTTQRHKIEDIGVGDKSNIIGEEKIYKKIIHT